MPAFPPITELAVLRTGLIIVTFLALFFLGAIAGGASMPVQRRAGIRGLKRQRMLSDGSAWSQLEPVLRWLGGRFRRVASEPLLESLDRQLSMGGDWLGLYPEELLGLAFLSGCGGVVAGALANQLAHLGPMVFLGCTGFGVVAPFMALSSAVAERLKSVSRRLPPAIDLLALAMGAGLDFPGAIRQVVDRSGTPDDPLIEELALILVSMSLGRTRREALEELAERCPIPMVKEFVGSVVQAELRGNPVADVLQIQAEVSRQKRSVLGEEAASKAAVRMIGPLMLIFLAILIVIVAPMAIQLKAQGF